MWTYPGYGYVQLRFGGGGGGGGGGGNVVRGMGTQHQSCGQFMQFVGPQMPPAIPMRGYDVSK